MKRLPVVGQDPPTGEPGDAGEDPLALIRGGRFARVFAVVLAVVGLVWLASDRARARDLEGVHVKVHHDVRDDPDHARLVAMVTRTQAPPPMPEVEELPNRGAPPPPMPEVEELPNRAAPPPPMPEVEELPNRGEEEVVVDRFGRKRTKSGAIIIDEGPEAEVGISDQVREQIEEGGFFDAKKLETATTVRKKAYVHLMPGIPNSVFFAAGAAILLLSFVLVERYGKNKDPRSRLRDYWRFELTRWRWLDRAMKSRWFQPLVQLPVVVGFIAVIVAGLVGTQEPGRNIAPVLTWNIWWIGLIFAVFFFGNLWCFMCPWTAIPDWLMRGSMTKVSKIRSLGRKYPRFKLWMWPAIILFGFVTWLEIIYDAANRPWLTSMLGIFMIVLAWVLLVIYERKAMCRYVCFVGRVSGQYALMGMLELRRRDPQLCKDECKTRDCFHGREGKGLPCPTHEFMGAMNENQYCTLCTECVKSCPHDNIGLRVRASGADLLHPHRAKKDEAYLAVLVFIVSAFHGAAMIPLWTEWEDRIRGWIIDGQVAVFGGDWLSFGGSNGGAYTFTLMMLACIVLPGLTYWGLCGLMRRASGRDDIDTKKVFVRFAYTLLPVALFYHLAHNATHVFYEWSKLRRLVSDPLGWNADYFGTARAPLSALWSPESIWYLQVALVIVGHIYGIIVAQREAFRLYKGDHKASKRVHLVMMIGMILMSMLSLWLLAQPMFMRTADV